MKLFHKRGGGVNRISYFLFRTAYVFINTVKVLNKDFIKVVQGGDHRFVKLVNKILLFFLKDGFPKEDSKEDSLLFGDGKCDCNGFDQVLANY